MTASLRECRMITRARPAAVARCFSCCLVSLLESSRRGAGDVTVTGVEGACAATGWEEPMPAAPGGTHRLAGHDNTAAHAEPPARLAVVGA